MSWERLKSLNAIHDALRAGWRIIGPAFSQRMAVESDLLDACKAYEAASQSGSCKAMQEAGKLGRAAIAQAERRAS
jgi:hypothetical protein